tara:strand:- start:567 stop:827 length:261 start_codon:yes stop_codon:yes gene_type:complete
MELQASRTVLDSWVRIKYEYKWFMASTNVGRLHGLPEFAWLNVMAMLTPRDAAAMSAACKYANIRNGKEGDSSVYCICVNRRVDLS